MLPPDEGRDKWVETLDHNQKMVFLATRTIPPSPGGQALREVRLNDNGASYGGTWTYTIAPGPAPNTTTLQITESGFIKPWFYRFMMAHVVGDDEESRPVHARPASRHKNVLTSRRG